MDDHSGRHVVAACGEALMKVPGTGQISASYSTPILETADLVGVVAGGQLFGKTPADAGLPGPRRITKLSRPFVINAIWQLGKLNS
jgi:hypothetical protein